MWLLLLVRRRRGANLRLGEFRAHIGQQVVAVLRVRIRGAEETASPRDHVLQDGLGFEQVVACVGIKNGRVAAAHRC